MSEVSRVCLSVYISSEVWQMYDLVLWITNVAWTPGKVQHKHRNEHDSTSQLSHNKRESINAVLIDS